MKSNFPETITAQIVNASPGDAKFLRGIVALFADPANELILSRIRTGNFALQYNLDDGEAYIVDLRTGTAGAPTPVVQFIGRFSDTQWEELTLHQPDLVEIARMDIDKAEDVAKDILGYLPDTESMEVANG
ncbi:MAG: hypothetical protein H7Y43_00935 [Akkermansiaceae bacterium]|nr:hypothetical protein [Verrucomicrobiales bacterium]